MSKSLSEYSYFGGKSANGSNKINQWIHSLLPVATYRSCYCEPFAGMLGILLNRPRVLIEIANDSSERIISLWRAIRDQPNELFEKLDKTLYHQSEFEWAVENVDQLQGLDKATAVATILFQSMHKTAYAKSFSVTYSKNIGRKVTSRSEQFFLNLHHRIKDVQFVNTDALKLMKRIADNPDFVIYVDPPYENASTQLYGMNNQIDHDNLKDVLINMTGKVAISGYGDTYDDLGWRRHEKDVLMYSMTSNLKTLDKRTEVLWTNYEPNSNPTLFS